MKGRIVMNALVVLLLRSDAPGSTVVLENRWCKGDAESGELEAC
jgi:hypothetical protein